MAVVANGASMVNAHCALIMIFLHIEKERVVSDDDSAEQGAVAETKYLTATKAAQMRRQKVKTDCHLADWAHIHKHVYSALLRPLISSLNVEHR